MEPTLLERQVDETLGELLQPRNHGELERFRFCGTTNRVYRVPLDSDGGEFIIVKLLPPHWTDLKVKLKRTVRNLLYGENDVSVGRKRAQVEIERYQEWQEAGFPIPQIIKTRFPEVRVFLGLPHPTLEFLLAGPALSVERKLQVIHHATMALSFQHKVAMNKGRSSLIHRDPGPSNILVDLATDRVYWFDLEHPSTYPKMTVESVMARAVRVFLHGVLAHLDDHLDEILQIFVADYELEPVVWRYITSMEKRRDSRFYRNIEMLRRNGSSRLIRLGITENMRRRLETKSAM